MAAPGRSVSGLLLSLALTIVVAGPALGVCTADGYEEDGACPTASASILDGETQSRNLCDDAFDWVAVNVCAGRGYTAEATALLSGGDTVVELYSPDCSVLEQSDTGAAPGSVVSWTATQNGTAHLRVRSGDGSFGDQTDYLLSLTGDTTACSTWSRQYNAPGNQPFIPGTAILDPDGGYAAIDSGSEDWTLLRLDPDGDVRSSTVVGSQEDDFSHHLVLAPDGSYFANGSIYHPEQGGSLEPVVAKFDGSGQLLWSRGYGEGELTGLAALEDGGVVASHATTRGEAWVLRLDPAGGIVWSRSYGERRFIDVFGHLTIRNGGDILAVGYRIDSSDDADLLVLRLDPSGNIVRRLRFGEAGLNEYPRVVVPSADGGLFVTGIALLPDGTDPRNPESDIVLKLDSTDDVLWYRRFESDAVYEGVRGALATPDGGVLVAVDDGTVIGDTGISWAGLVKLDEAGNIEWARRSGSNSQSRGIIATPDGGLLTSRAYFPNVFEMARLGAPDTSSCAYPTAFSLTLRPWAPVVGAYSTEANDYQVTAVPDVFATIERGVGMTQVCPACPFPGYGATLRLRKTPAIELYWTASDPSVLHDVVKGHLPTLLATGGDFIAAIEAVPATDRCVADNVGSSVVDPDPGPPPDEAYFYVMRPFTTSCPTYGSYDCGPSCPYPFGRNSYVVQANESCP